MAGGVYLTWNPSLSSAVGLPQPVGQGLVLISVLLFLPGGVVPFLAKPARSVPRRVQRRPDAPRPPTADVPSDLPPLRSPSEAAGGGPVLLRLEHLSVGYGGLNPSRTPRCPCVRTRSEGLKAVQLVKSPSDPDPSVKEFRTARAEYEPGRTAGLLALGGWSNAKVFAEIVKSIKGPVASETIIAAYQKASAVDPGVSPVMHFSPTDHLGTRSVQRVVVKNGVWTPLGDFYTPPVRD
ncbi:hypothetical protein [Streptomyces sp. NPDC005476]|uniref:hypothetical protein n=1 Tax=Streptomyces sp. NPDC005476 TaxID=3156882 RepID=UPI003456142E